MKRKILSLILVFAMTVSLFTVGAGAAEPIYRDTDGHWAAETIEGFSRLGLIEGYNGQFFPNKNITRGEMAVILDRLMSYQTAAANSFSDLGDAFYTDAVLKANAAGVMLGSNGTVRPTDPITRQEAAVLLCRALGLEVGGSVAQFSDRGQIASWAADAVGAMAAKKLLQGANGMFRPTDAITRAETVAILDRALGKLVSEGESASGRVDGNVVVRGAGAKLSDMTINGDLIIAEGVGVGEVHLNGVTITGRTIVRGGGVNSIYMNNVRANGGVVVNKLDGRVRVVTSGNTTVSVTLLQSGAILVGDGFKTVEIPADVAKGQTVEIQGNIERLVNNSEDAKITANGTIQTVEANAKTEIKGDAKVVGATGSADVKVNGSAVAKTDKPAAGGSTGGSSSGGSSTGGNSSTASKEITGAEKVTLKVGYGEKTAEEALEAIPKTVTLKLKDGSTITATATKWEWDTNAAYTQKPTTGPASTPATATVAIPSGYTYNGTLIAKATVTVYPLDKKAFDDALAAAKTQQSQFEEVTESAKVTETATNPDKIYIVPDGTDASAITKDVKFVLKSNATAYTTLNDTITKAEAATAFASQTECDKMTKELKDAMDAVDGMTKQTGTSTTTDAYIQSLVEYNLSPQKNPDAAYFSGKQPLKMGTKYQLYNFIGTNLPDRDGKTTGILVSKIDWAVSGKGATNAEVFKDPDFENSPRARVTSAPSEPLPVEFVATVECYNQTTRQTSTVTVKYPATIGAPISVSADQPIDLPQFTVISDGKPSSTGATNFTGVVPITLTGADAIASAPNDCVTMDSESTASGVGEVAFRSISVDKVEKSDTGLNVTVSVTTGSISGVWDENSPYPFKEGTLPNISIDTRKFQLKENTLGWYLPSSALDLGDMTVEVLTPAFTKVERNDDPTGNPTFTIHTQNMPENAKVEVALAKTDVTTMSDIENSTIKKDATRGDDGKYSVTFDKNQFDSNATYYLWFRYGSPGSDWAYEKVTNRPTYTFNNTTGGGITGSESEGGGNASGSPSGSGESSGGGTGSQTGA